MSNETPTSFRRMTDEVVSSIRTAHRASKVAHLFALTDAELAARGLSRERIFQSVFGR